MKRKRKEINSNPSCGLLANSYVLSALYIRENSLSCQAYKHIKTQLYISVPRRINNIISLVFYRHLLKIM
jgi:hypothetical protein